MSLPVYLIDMSTKAGYIALALIASRLILKKLPRSARIVLWLFVAFRLMCPISIKSIVSLLPSRATTPDVILNISDKVLSTIREYINSKYMTGVWLVGVVVLIIYTSIRYILIRAKTKSAINIADRVWLCEGISSPIIIGFIKPSVYIPMSTDMPDLWYIITHEVSHLQRGDHIYRWISMLFLWIYWFNPIIWISFYLIQNDIEYACDEYVLRRYNGVRPAYISVLQKMYVPFRQRVYNFAVISERNICRRMNVLEKSSKPGFWHTATAFLVCGIIGITLLTDPLGAVQSKNTVYVSWKGNIDRGTLVRVIDEYENRCMPLRRNGTNVFSLTIDKGLTQFGIIHFCYVTKGYTELDTILSYTPDVSYDKSSGIVEISTEGTMFNTTGKDESSVFSYILFTLDESGDTTYYYLRADYAQRNGDDYKPNADYYNLDTSNGLVVYVWKMSPDTYNFGLMPDINKERTFEDIINMKGVSMDHIKEILKSYNLPKSKLVLRPINQPISSYMWLYDYYELEKLKNYLDIEKVSCDTALYHDSINNAIDSIIADIDADGYPESCYIMRGHTSGLFSFYLLAMRDGKVAYYDLFVLDQGVYSFYLYNDALYLIKTNVLSIEGGIKQVVYRVLVTNNSSIVLFELDKVDMWDPQNTVKDIGS